MKKKFEALDKDGSNTLDVKELGALLKKGNPAMTDAGIKKLYDSVDKNGDGVVDFDEFLDYLYGKERADHSNDRAVGGRHARLSTERNVGVDDTETQEVWDAVKAVFAQYGSHQNGQHIVNKEWAQLCKDTKLVGGGFAKHDVDLLWTKVCPKGSRQIGFAEFQNLIRMVANKKQCANIEVLGKIATAGAGGPQLHATQMEAVRFHDDKDTYTGAHVARFS